VLAVYYQGSTESWWWQILSVDKVTRNDAKVEVVQAAGLSHADKKIKQRTDGYVGGIHFIETMMVVAFRSASWSLSHSRYKKVPRYQ